VKTNRSGIDAKVKVIVENKNHTEQAFYRQVGSGGSWGASPLAQEIGLGKAKRIKTIQIYWPASKTTQTLKDLPMDEFIEIEESKPQYTKRELPAYRLGGNKMPPNLRASQ